MIVTVAQIDKFEVFPTLHVSVAEAAGSSFRQASAFKRCKLLVVGFGEHFAEQFSERQFRILSNFALALGASPSGVWPAY